MKIAFLGMLVVGIFATRASGQVPAKSIPEFRLFARDGKAYTRENLPKEKMSFFMFFDPECDHCQHAMTELNKKYKSFDPVTVCLLSVDSWDKIDRFMKSYGPSIRLRKNVKLLRDSLNQFITKFQPRRYPAMFLYSVDGKILDYEDTPEAVFRFVRLIDANKSPSKK